MDEPICEHNQGVAKIQKPENVPTAAEPSLKTHKDGELQKITPAEPSLKAYKKNNTLKMCQRRQSPR